MKKALIAAALMLLVVGAARAMDKPFGLGLIFGEPSGISFKYWTGNTTAIDAGAAWSFINESAFQMHGDLLFHNFNVFQVDRGRMALYYGFGARLKLADRTKFSLRVPLGISYEFERADIEIFMEVVPMMDLAPATQAAIAGGVGFRYYF